MMCDASFKYIFSISNLQHTILLWSESWMNLEKTSLCAFQLMCFCIMPFFYFPHLKSSQSIKNQIQFCFSIQGDSGISKFVICNLSSSFINHPNFFKLSNSMTICTCEIYIIYKDLSYQNICYSLPGIGLGGRACNYCGKGRQEHPCKSQLF